MKQDKQLEFESLLSGLKDKFRDLRPGSKQERAFLMHMASLARVYAEPMDYPEIPEKPFPPTLPVAQAVCHPECGTSEIIVDGSTQECQNCGGTMFRTAIASYRLIPAMKSKKATKQSRIGRKSSAR
jgi:hypothetical protein